MASAFVSKSSLEAMAKQLADKGMPMWLLRTCSTNMNLVPALRSCFYPKDLSEVDLVHKIHSSKLHRCLLASEFMVLESKLKGILAKEGGSKDISDAWPKPTLSIEDYFKTKAAAAVVTTADHSRIEVPDEGKFSQTAEYLQSFKQSCTDLQHLQRSHFLRQICEFDGENEISNKIINNLEKIDGDVLKRFIGEGQPRQYVRPDKFSASVIPNKNPDILKHLMESPRQMTMHAIINLTDNIRDFGIIDFKMNQLSGTLKSKLIDYAKVHSICSNEFDTLVAEQQLENPDLYENEWIKHQGGTSKNSTDEETDFLFETNGQQTDCGDAKYRLPNDIFN